MHTVSLKVAIPTGCTPASLYCPPPLAHVPIHWIIMGPPGIVASPSLLVGAIREPASLTLICTRVCCWFNRHVTSHHSPLLGAARHLQVLTPNREPLPDAAASQQVPNMASKWPELRASFFHRRLLSPRFTTGKPSMYIQDFTLNFIKKLGRYVSVLWKD